VTLIDTFSFILSYLIILCFEKWFCKKYNAPLLLKAFSYSVSRFISIIIFRFTIVINSRDIHVFQVTPEHVYIQPGMINRKHQGS